MLEIVFITLSGAAYCVTGNSVTRLEGRHPIIGFDGDIHGERVQEWIVAPQVGERAHYVLADGRGVTTSLVTSISLVGHRAEAFA